jgi:hypothetical protein
MVIFFKKTFVINVIANNFIGFAYKIFSMATLPHPHYSSASLSITPTPTPFLPPFYGVPLCLY